MTPSRRRRPAGRALLAAGLAVLAFSGCMPKMPRRDPHTVFPGQPAWDRRLASFNLDPLQARQRAWDAARADGRPQYVGRHPAVAYGQYYVFSMPEPEGASLKGYHVHGKTSEVKFWVGDDKVFIKK